MTDLVAFQFAKTFDFQGAMEWAKGWTDGERDARELAHQAAEAAEKFVAGEQTQSLNNFFWFLDSARKMKQESHGDLDYLLLEEMAWPWWVDYMEGQV